jgi:uncharacterized coiled-coil protein SlyX
MVNKNGDKVMAKTLEELDTAIVKCRIRSQEMAEQLHFMLGQMLRAKD